MTFFVIPQVCPYFLYNQNPAKQLSWLSLCENNNYFRKSSVLCDRVLNTLFNGKNNAYSVLRLPDQTFLNHLFPVHAFSTSWKHQKTVTFSDVLGGRERGHWTQKGYYLLNHLKICPKTLRISLKTLNKWTNF